jgi:hypothetical protein
VTPALQSTVTALDISAFMPAQEKMGTGNALGNADSPGLVVHEIPVDLPTLHY